MRSRLWSLTLNQRLALLAFALGALALAAHPTRARTVTIDPAELALIVQRDADHVDVATLADLLVKGQSDFRLVDVRSEQDYAASHIPLAENIPIGALPEAGLPRNEKVVLYAEDGVHAAQAWFLLKAQGHKGAYMLRGGLAEWREQILSPVLLPAPTAEQRQENEKRAAVAAFFGGAARNAANAVPPSHPSPAQVVSTPAAPPPAAIPMPSVPPKAKPAVKRKEGC